MANVEANEMLVFGRYVLAQGINKLHYIDDETYGRRGISSKLVNEKRMAVVHIIHGIELIFKAILLNQNYSIEKIRSRIYPIENESKLDDLLDPDRTIELSIIIEFFKKKYTDINFSCIERLNRIRNQIQHRGTKIGKKDIRDFIDSIQIVRDVHKREFPKRKSFDKYLETAIEQLENPEGGI